MHDSHSADFYHGWIIEIVQEDGGFKSTCYSPSRERYSDYVLHPSDADALVSARHGIDRYVVRHQLASFLRELYEVEKISFDEWRLLNRSLNQHL
jgi:hypothetical protein